MSGQDSISGLTPENSHPCRQVRSRFTPQPKVGRRPARLRLEPRDQQLLTDLFLHQVMSRSQLQALYFGSVQRCNLRLRRLFDFGYVTRHYPPAAPFGAQAIYAVGKAALPLIAAHLAMDWAQVRQHYRRHRTPTFLEHTLEIVNVRLALLQACLNTRDVKIERWLPEMRCRHEYQIRHGETGRCTKEVFKKEVFKPDAFVRLQPANRLDYLSYFIEVDLGHTSATQFLHKLAIHHRYLDSGLFAEVFGGDRFQTLVITTTAGRLRNLQALVEAQGSDLFWFTTFDSINQRGILEAIWQVPHQPSHQPRSLCG